MTGAAATRTILFVDDEEGVLRSMRRLLRRHEDLTVLTASNAEEGTALFAERRIHVVVSDQRMPGTSGIEFLKHVRTHYPDTVRCILSGYAEMHAVVEAINEGNVYRFIAKPWDDDALIHILKDCLAEAERRYRRVDDQEQLVSRAEELDRKAAKYAELLDMQQGLLAASREVLEHLPIAVASIDTQGRMIYTNRLFAAAFGGLPGSVLGRKSEAPWDAIAQDPRETATVSVRVGNAEHVALTSKVDIGGQMHTLIAVPV